ncbi:hypothetical protein [Dongia sp.]|uniref:hypothetical protein n=1 Tax=Dongia sp. TaxID=1977262 RepID=UPI0035AE773E
MTGRMRDEEFEALLESALGVEAAPPALARRLDRAAPRRGIWLMALMSPARMAASAALLSLLTGFVLGWGNASVSDEQEFDVVASIYTANDVGEY